MWPKHIILREDVPCAIPGLGPPCPRPSTRPMVDPQCPTSGSASVEGWLVSPFCRFGAGVQKQAKQMPAGLNFVNYLGWLLFFFMKLKPVIGLMSGLWGCSTAQVQGRLCMVWYVVTPEGGSAPAPHLPTPSAQDCVWAHRPCGPGNHFISRGLDGFICNQECLGHISEYCSLWSFIYPCTFTYKYTSPCSLTE